MSPKGSQERQQAAQMLLTQARWSTLTMKQSVEAVLALSQVCPLRSKEREEGIEVLSALAHRPDLSIEDAWTFITLDFDFVPLSIIEATPALKRQQGRIFFSLWLSALTSPLNNPCILPRLFLYSVIPGSRADI